MIKTVYEHIFQVPGISEDLMSKGTQGQGDIHKGEREGGNQILHYFHSLVIVWTYITHEHRILFGHNLSRNWHNM